MKPATTARLPGVFIRIVLSGMVLVACERPTVPQAVVQLDPVQQKYENWLARGTGAIPEIREILADDQVQDFRLRTHAVLAAGTIGAEELAPEIERLLRDSDNTAVKNCALIALADLERREAVPLILSFMPGGKNEEVQIDRGIVLEQLGRLQDDRAIPTMIGALESENDQLRLKAQNALVALASPAAIGPLLKLHKKDGEGVFDKEVAVVLGATKDPRSGPALLKLIKRPGSKGRVAAVNGAGQLDYEPALPALLGILRQRQQNEVGLLVKSTGRSIARLDMEKSVEPLIGLFDAPSLSLRLVVAATLGEMTVKSIPGKVLARLERGGRRAIIPAALVLGLKQYKNSAGLLRHLYEKHDGAESFYTAQALGRIGDRTSIPILLQGLQNRAGEPAYGAAYALGAMKSTEAVEPMIAILGASARDLTLKKHCVAALGEIGDVRAVKAIIELPLGEKSEMGDLVGRALGKLGGDDVFRYLQRAIQSDDVNERRVARLTLIHFSDPQRIEFFLKLLESPDAKTRRAAMTALRKNTGKNFGTEQEWVDWADDR